MVLVMMSVVVVIMVMVVVGMTIVWNEFLVLRSGRGNSGHGNPRRKGDRGWLRYKLLRFVARRWSPDRFQKGEKVVRYRMSMMMATP